MKKIIITLLFMIIMPLFAAADVIPHKVMAVVQNDLSYKTLKNGQIIELISIDNYKVSENLELKQGEKFNIKVLEYKKPKRGKRDGYYKIQYEELNINGTMRVSTPKDMESIVKNIGVSVAGHVLKIPGFSQAVAVSKGLIKPTENKSRLASAGENLYQSTPLTYVESGKDFIIEKDGIVVLKLRQQTNIEE